MFAGTIWVAQYGVNEITVLVPGTPPVPDTDQDDDGLDDNLDPLQYDASNGLNTVLSSGERLFWDFNPGAGGVHPGESGEYNIGLTGWMINGVDDLSGLTDLDNTIRGGAPGIFQVESVGTGDYLEFSNDQQDAIQTGFSIGTGVDKFTIKVPVFNPFSSDANSTVTWSDAASMGIALGDGSMSNLLSISVGAKNANGDPRIRVLYEEDDVKLADFEVDAPDILNAVDDDQIEFFLSVDLAALQVLPMWRYQMGTVWSPIQQVGIAPIQLQSEGVIAQVLQGNYEINGVQSSPVVSLVSTSTGSQPFTADFLDLAIGTPSVVIQPIGGTSALTVVEGDVANVYSVVLGAPPTANVTVSITPNSSDITLDKTQVVFTPDNWADPQAVSVQAVDDEFIEGDETVSISHTVASTDSDYAGLSLPDLSVNVIDNDIPEVLLVESDGSTVVGEDGTTDSYSLVLATQPSSDVTVTLVSDAEISLSTTNVVFTAANWDTPQSITITTEDDAIAEGNEIVPVSHNVSSADPAYDGLSVSDLSVTITDNDGPVLLHRINVGGEEVVGTDGIAWSADTSASPSPYHAGSSKFFSYGTAPVDLSDSSLSGTAAVAEIFRTERWDNPAGQNMKWEFALENGDYEVRLYLAELYAPSSAVGARVFDVSVEGVVSAAFDDLDAYALGGDNVGVMVSGAVSLNDGLLNLEFLHGNGNPALKGIEILAFGELLPPEISIDDVIVDESAGTATFTVSLSRTSDSDVTVDFTTMDGTADAGDYTATAGNLVFLSGETTKDIAVSITDDGDEEGDETFSVELSNANGASLADAIGTGTILANDVPPELSISDVIVSESGIASFTVTLSVSSPTAVTVDYSIGDVSDTAESGLDYVDGAGTLSFGPGDINKTIEVGIIDDILLEGEETFIVHLTNPNGAILGDATGVGTIIDNDTSEVLLVESDGSTVVGEDGTTDSYSLVLAAQPSSDVMITLVSDPEISLSTTNVVFTAANWDTPQSITITTADDAIAEGNEIVTVSHNVSSADPAYDGLSVSDLSVTITDNDGPVLLHRINVGGEEVVGTDGIAWSADTSASPSPYHTGGGKFHSYGTASVDLSDPSLQGTAAVEAIFQTERWDNLAGQNMKWEFALENGDYEVRLYLAELYGPSSSVGARVFDVSVEGAVSAAFDDLDAYALGGDNVGVMVSGAVSINDGLLNLEFLHGNGNPALKGIEILTLGELLPPEISIDDVIVDESAGTANFTVSLSRTSDSDVTVDFTTMDGIADAGDYTATTGNLVFLAGETTKDIAVSITDDGDEEGDETFSVELSNANGASLADAIGTGTILANDVPSIPALSIDDVDVSESSAIATFTVNLSEPSDAAITVDYTTVDGTAQDGSDYVATTGQLTFSPGDTAASIDVDLIGDSTFEGNETFTVELSNISAGAVISDGVAMGTIIEDDPSSLIGAAVLSITPQSNDVQVSNFNNNSFKITNTGEKAIAQIELDVTNSLFPDSVFDPFGEAGDSTSKPLTINTPGATGVVLPSTLPTSETYLGSGLGDGFHGIRLTFDEAVDGGFETNETVGFSIDMDPNSVAGTSKAPLDAGSDPAWDVGGVSGAELIGSTFTVTFTDGTIAIGQLHGTNTQAGSKALAAQDSPNLAVSLNVNGLTAGGVGSYTTGGPSVMITGPAGETARVVLTKGFIQPVNPYTQDLADQLAALALEDFPANNAVEFQTFDVVLTGEEQDISNLFNFSGVEAIDFSGEDQLPLGFVASVIDLDNDNLPLGPVTQPIYLEFSGQPEVSIASTQNAAEPGTDGQFVVSLSETSDSETTVAFSVSGSATPGQDYSSLTGTVTIPANSLSADITVPVLDDADIETDETVIVTLDTITAGNSDISIGSADTATVILFDDDTSAVLFSETDGSTEVSENGLTDTYSLLLGTQPLNDVTITLSPSDQLQLSTSEVVFTTENWNVAQEVTISAVNDTVSEGNEVVTIAHGISSSDPAYGSLTVSDLSVTVVDNDGPVLLHRINVGGEEVVGTDGIAWSADTSIAPSPYHTGGW